jgi:sugar lactone lactonase YvrE
MSVALGGIVAPGRRRAGAQATPSTTAGTTTYAIPGERVFPEGIAYDPATGAFFVGSTEDGTIFRGDLEAGGIARFLAGGQDGRTAVTGLKVDAAGRLVVCGRRTGRIFVYDTASGELLDRVWNGRTDGTLINDVAIAPDGVGYVTDSFLPVLYRLDLTELPIGGGSTPAAGIGERETDVFVDFTGSALAYADGFNANGIVATPDGTALLIVQFNTGRLYRLELGTRAVTEVPLTGGDLLGGDGLALEGTTLWALLDTTGELIRVELNRTLDRGEVVASVTDPTFAYPTTLALVGDGTALVVNSQLDMSGEGAAPTLPFTVSRIVLER